LRVHFFVINPFVTLVFPFSLKWYGGAPAQSSKKRPDRGGDARFGIGSDSMVAKGLDGAGTKKGGGGKGDKAKGQTYRSCVCDSRQMPRRPWSMPPCARGVAPCRAAPGAGC
jgi:hypothetical protein